MVDGPSFDKGCLVEGNEEREDGLLLLRWKTAFLISSREGTTTRN